MTSFRTNQRAALISVALMLMQYRLLSASAAKGGDDGNTTSQNTLWYDSLGDDL